jgi:hypothetical protein
MIKTEQVDVNDPNLIAFAHELLNAVHSWDLNGVERVTNWFRFRARVTYGAVVKLLESIHADKQDIESYNQILYDLDGSER